MRVILPKTLLGNLTVKPHTSGLRVGAQATLELLDDQKVAAFVTCPSRWPFGWGTQRFIRAGYLGETASNLLTPALEKQAKMRVRVIEIEPAHLSRTRKDEVYLSVWGNPDDFQPNAKHPL